MKHCGRIDEAAKTIPHLGKFVAPSAAIVRFKLKIVQAAAAMMHQFDLYSLARVIYFIDHAVWSDYDFPRSLSRRTRHRSTTQREVL